MVKWQAQLIGVAGHVPVSVHREEDDGDHSAVTYQIGERELEVTHSRDFWYPAPLRTARLLIDGGLVIPDVDSSIRIHIGAAPIKMNGRARSLDCWTYNGAADAFMPFRRGMLHVSSKHWPLDDLRLEYLSDDALTPDGAGLSDDVEAEADWDRTAAAESTARLLDGRLYGLRTDRRPQLSWWSQRADDEAAVTLRYRGERGLKPSVEVSMSKPRHGLLHQSFMNLIVQTKPLLEEGSLVIPVRRSTCEVDVDGRPMVWQLLSCGGRWLIWATVDGLSVSVWSTGEAPIDIALQALPASEAARLLEKMKRPVSEWRLDP